jgi:hypothetical protein
MGTRTLVSFDYAVKRLLRNKADYEVLEGFLSELFRRPLKIDSILESESNKDGKDDKQNRVDMLVKDENGEMIIIEIQFTREIDYFHRMLYGVSKTIAEHIAEGNEYKEVKKLYSVNVVYFDFGFGADYVYHGKTRFTGIHKNDELLLSNTQRETFGKQSAGDIFPEYYILKVNSFNNVAKDTLDEWMYYLKNSQIKDDFKAQGLQKAAEILNIGLLSPEEKRDYDKAVDMRRSNDSSIWTAKIEGREEGRAEGREEGKIEEKLEIARRMKEAGTPLSQIVQFTNLSPEEIDRL